ncbi:uncharacterized protein LTHEOB_11709 [Lasiodiplodia theobromae]|uniref:uncharacterized protein n=1 Tax=Lasiodiplodia theobromae TaxID=45133 RepID=UPI0015C387DC|nr:uncharacterized protein LTHEOB_11709 [Lasiodiplodia theobromae]KAF4537000.1 hypothetical protein LTHEOB_11709 [Lasiodiplodia theobromae]
MPRRKPASKAPDKHIMAPCLVAAEPTAPRKRRAQNHEDLTTPQPLRKKTAIDNASERSLVTESHDVTPGKVVISPTGTICKCHLKPGAICWHQIHEPHVSNPRAREKYERLAPAKQAMQRVRANQAKNKSNEIEELKIDAAMVSQEGDEWLKRQNVREKRAAASNIDYAQDGKEDSKDWSFEEDDTKIEESDVDVEDSEDEDDDQDGDYVDDADDHQEQVNVEDDYEEPANDGRDTDFEDDEEIPCMKKCEPH